MKSLKFNATLNAVRQVCGILFPIVSFSYASRTVGAQGIGVYSFSRSIINYVMLIAAIGVSHYGVREGCKIRNDLSSLQTFCDEVYSINILFTVLSYIVLGILIAFWGKLDNYRTAIYIQSISIIIITVSADWINTIFEDYLYITIRYIIVQTISLLVLVILVKTSSDLYTYIVLCTITSVGGNLFNIVYIRKKVKLHFTFNMHFRKHIVPLLILFFNSIASVIYLNSDITMIGIFKDDGAVGIYTSATKVYSALKTLINGLIYVAIPRFSYFIGYGMKDNYQRGLRKLFRYVTIISIPSVVGLVLLSKNIILMLSGVNYLAGISAMQILALAFPFAVWSCFFSYAVLIPNRNEKFFMLSTICAALANIFLNLFLIPMLGINGAALTTLLAEILVFLISSYYSRKTIVINFGRELLLPVLSGCAAVTLVCLFTLSLNLNYILSSFLCISLSVSFYCTVLFLFKVPEISEIFTFVKKTLHIH